MKTKKYCFILAVVIAILCVPALGEVKSPRFIEEDLIASVNPALAGIEKLYVNIVPLDTEPNKNGLIFKELETKVINNLLEAGMKVVGSIKTVMTVGLAISELSELRVDIDMLKPVPHQKSSGSPGFGAGQYVFRIQASVLREVRLARRSDLALRANVWRTQPVMQLVSVENMSAKVTNVVSEHVEAFIQAWLAANPQGVQSPDAEKSGTVSLPVQAELSRPIGRPAVAEYNYVASKNSKVFHKAECSSAKRIKPENIVGYNSRDEAIDAGKRPCKICKP